MLRHTTVSERWLGRCYGRSDAALSLTGFAEARRLVCRLALPGVKQVHVSPRRRSLILGGRLARRHGLLLIVSPLLAERDFGSWEGRRWDDIHAESGDAMLGMLSAPEAFRPGGGETTSELADRARAWLTALPPMGSVLAVTHGGPIGALAGQLLGRRVADWPSLVPPLGTGLELRQEGTRWSCRPWGLEGCR